jgi:hypothetical protein
MDITTPSFPRLCLRLCSKPCASTIRDSSSSGQRLPPQGTNSFPRPNPSLGANLSIPASHREMCAGAALALAGDADSSEPDAWSRSRASHARTADLEAQRRQPSASSRRGEKRTSIVSFGGGHSRV